MNTWDVAVSLTNCDWSLFSNVHEVKTRTQTHEEIFSTNLYLTDGASNGNSKISDQIECCAVNDDIKSIFSNPQQELVYFTLSRDASCGHTVALEQLLQRCNETQQWVMTEVLLCPTLCKRVQLFKKCIKIAAQ